MKIKQPEQKFDENEAKTPIIINLSNLEICSSPLPDWIKERLEYREKTKDISVGEY